MNSQNEMLTRIGDSILSTEQQAALRSVRFEEDRMTDSEMGLAALRLLERLGRRLSKKQLCAAIEIAGRLLDISHDLSVVRRVAKINRQALLWTNVCPGRPDWSKFNLREVQLRNECHYVEQALADANGSVTKAAELLGLASHQSLLYMLNGRLKDLVKRPATKPRRRKLKAQKSAKSTY